MKLTKAEKSVFAIKLKAKVNEAYDRETQSSKTDLSYLGVCKITDMIEQEFIEKAGEYPTLIEGACHLARALRNPDKMKTKEDLRKGFALLVTTVGGLSITWGILSMLSLWTAFWIFVFGVYSPIFGLLSIFGGLAAAVAGVYVAITKRTPQELSAKAHDLLIESISNWSDEEMAKLRDVAARKQLLQNYSHAEVGTTKDSMVWKTVTWPYRTVADFVDAGPKNLSEPSHKPRNDEG